MTMTFLILTWEKAMMLLNLPEKDQVAEKIIKGLPKDNDKYYIEHTKNSNTSNIKQDKKQQEKDGLSKTILNIE